MLGFWVYVTGPHGGLGVHVCLFLISAHAYRASDTVFSRSSWPSGTGRMVAFFCACSVQHGSHRGTLLLRSSVPLMGLGNFRINRICNFI